MVFLEDSISRIVFCSISLDSVSLYLRQSSRHSETPSINAYSEIDFVILLISGIVLAALTERIVLLSIRFTALRKA